MRSAEVAGGAVLGATDADVGRPMLTALGPDMQTYRDPAEAIRAAQDRIATIERDLAEARDALAAAELALANAVQPVQVDRSALTVGEVAEALHMARSTVNALIASGRLESVKLGGSRRITPAQLAAYIDAQNEVAA